MRSALIVRVLILIGEKMSKEINKEALVGVLDGLVGAFDIETTSLFLRLVENMAIEKISDYNELYLFLIFPFEKFIDGAIMSIVNNNYDVRFLLSKSHFVENHLCEMFQREEGLACCADKARTVISALINFYKTGREISFNYDGEYTYHLPKKILKTHGECVSFYEALKGLYYGKPDKYIQSLKAVLETNEVEDKP